MSLKQPQTAMKRTYATEAQKKSNPCHIGVARETFVALDAIRQKRARDIGVELSWDKFFRLYLRDLGVEV